MQVWKRPSTELFSEVVTVAARYKKERDSYDELTRCGYEAVFPEQDKADLGEAFHRLIHCAYEAAKSCLHLFKWLHIEEVIRPDCLFFKERAEKK